jgi:L-aminopeptidase/D-esterase-like protein
VRRFLERKGVGFETGAAKVPIVPCAILYDLGIGKANVRPHPRWAKRRRAATGEAVKEGCVGAGTGATIGKLVGGMRQAMKSGIGSRPSR